MALVEEQIADHDQAISRGSIQRLEQLLYPAPHDLPPSGPARGRQLVEGALHAGVVRGEIVTAFRAAEWLGPHDLARTETGLSALERELSALCVVRRDAREPKKLELHGLVTTATSDSDLADLALPRAPGTDFLWLAVPTASLETATERMPHMLGLLEFTRSRALRVARAAKRRRPTAEGRLDTFTALLQQAYAWP